MAAPKAKADAPKSAQPTDAVDAGAQAAPEPAASEPKAEAAPVAPAPTMDTKPSMPSGTGRFKVWDLGALCHDGATYEAGAECTLPLDVAAKLGPVVTPL